jgi:ABC-type transport system involved in cytochrome bd biosynthesis fused ATPase/permease subunit
MISHNERIGRKEIIGSEKDWYFGALGVLSVLLALFVIMSLLSGCVGLQTALDEYEEVTSQVEASQAELAELYEDVMAAYQKYEEAVKSGVEDHVSAALEALDGAVALYAAKKENIDKLAKYWADKYEELKGKHGTSDFWWQLIGGGAALIIGLFAGVAPAMPLAKSIELTSRNIAELLSKHPEMFEKFKALQSADLGNGIVRKLFDMFRAR